MEDVFESVLLPVQRYLRRAIWVSVWRRLRRSEIVRFWRDGKEKLVEKAGAGGETLVRSAGELQRRMDEIIQAHDSLRRFVDHCECLSTTLERILESHITSTHSRRSATWPFIDA